MPVKKAITYGLASSSIFGGGIVAAALTTTTKVEEITVKDQWIKAGYSVTANDRFGPKIKLLEEYYGDFRSKINSSNLGAWCEEQGKITDKNKVNEYFEKFCLESIGSKIEEDINIEILKEGGDESEFYKNGWNNSFKTYQQNYKNNSTIVVSGDWNEANSLEDFKAQCKKNGSKSFNKDINALMEQVKTYCTQKRNFSS